MSVSKTTEGSGGKELTMWLPPAAPGTGFGSLTGSTGGLSVDLLADRDSCFPAIVPTGEELVMRIGKERATVIPTGTP